jgi:hypothetical protein
MPILIYRAGPQDDVTGDESRGWREELAAGAPSGVAFFSPAHAYLNVSAASFPPVDWLNRVAIEKSHAVIANLSGPGRAFGTIREIEYAAAHNTMVQVVGADERSLMTWDVYLADTLDDALNAILEHVMEARELMQRGFPGIGGMQVSIQPIPPKEADDEDAS